MDIWTGLLGGIGLFLLGMRLMTEGATLAAGETLKSGLAAATRSRSRALTTGFVITALVQSSSAVTVATIGFVNAGLMTFPSTVWLIYGTNVGNVMTGWLVALIGVRVSIGVLALPLLGLGMGAWVLARSRPRIAGAGEALAGFGAFFLGIDILQASFAGLAPQVVALTGGLADTVWQRPAFLLLGIVVTLLTQSSSATIAIVLTAAAGGSLNLEQAAAAVVGASIGTTSTALFAAMGATSTARRVAATHIGFNLVAGLAAFALLPPMLWLSAAIAGGTGNVALMLALFQTSYCLLGLALMAPLTPWLIRFLSARFRRLDKAAPPTRYLDATLVDLPELALRALAMEMDRLVDASFALAHDRLAGRPVPSESAARVLALGDAIRDYLGRINLGQLSPAAVDALSDTLRALQHLEELAQAARALPDPPGEPVASATAPDLARLIETAMQSCTQLDGEDVAARLESIGADSETIYETIKAGLLRGAASGRLPMAAADHALNYAREIRDLGAMGRKAQRRLAPWRVTDQAETEAPAPEATAA
ncbi:Na/Pi cotransporter family protein [Paracoccus siganidrum]|nr:Na/Pi symporter [Paracoccus siganidrum]